MNSLNIKSEYKNNNIILYPIQGFRYTYILFTD